MALLPVNVAEGFAPLLKPDFIARYGARSLFVRASADLFTRTLARMLEAKGRREPDQPMGRVVDDEALESLAKLVKRLGREAKSALSSASFGPGPSDAFEAYVDNACGAGAFSAWLGDFEARRFSDAAGRCLVARG